MFGSSPFGQSSSSPFGASPVFGQANNASNNPFAPKPFGSTSPFGTQTTSSMFGGTSTGVFGASSSSPLGTSTVFGASSSPAFGSSTPAFGASSTPAFGSSSSAFGSTSALGQKPTFGGFGSSTNQTSPFGSSFQQSQPAFGSNPFGSTPFGALSQPSFGSSSTPSFGATSTPAFGASTTPAFGSGGAFGNTGGGFGVSSSFPSSTPAFGSSSTPGFGTSSTPAFGASSTPAFGVSSTPAFGVSSTPAFGVSSTPAFGSSSTPSFNFGSSPSFGQSTSTFGSSPFGAASTPFGSQPSSFGAQPTTPSFGSSAFGGQRGGSRVAPYSQTPEADGSTSQPAGKLESISAMPVYKDKSHEELRWEDYQLGDKGGPAPAGQSTAAPGFGSSAFGSSPSSTFGQTPANPFQTSTSSNPFAPKTPASGFGSSTSTFGFQANTSSLFTSTPSTTTSPFGTTTPAFSPSPSPFSSSGSSTFGQSPSLFSSNTSAQTAPTFSFSNTQSSPLFQSNTPSLAQSGSAFGQSTPGFGQSTPAFGQSPSPFGQSPSPFGGQSNLFNSPSTGFANLFSSTSTLTTTSNAIGLGQSTPAQSSSGFSFSNLGSTQPAGTSGFGGAAGIFGQNIPGQFPGAQSSMVVPPAPVTNPYGTLPAMPQMSIGRSTTSPSVQYGISSLPVVDKPAPVRISSLLTSRHLSQRRTRLPVRKYNPKTDGPKVPFFSDEEETPSTPKADALFIPRDNPRTLVIRPLEKWPSRASAERPNPTQHPASPTNENGKTATEVNAPANGHAPDNKYEDSLENGLSKEQPDSSKLNQKSNGVHNGVTTQKGDSYISFTGHRAGEAAIVYEHGADIEALMPKLRHSDYYTEPRIQELAAKERAEPGFCRHVEDFVVGRHGFGSIKFFGETDVRRLDLESLVQFNNREVIVYMDESKKPPIGQGLNKPAEVTLLNIKCFDKKTGQQVLEGPRIQKYKEMLKRKAEEQGAEFVSYDPVKGEWKFRVNHFSEYKLGSDDESDEPWLAHAV